ALYGGGASSKVVVTGSGAKVTVNGAPALLDAGRTLNIDLLGNLTNTGSHIAAGGDMSLSGNTLDNEGYATSVVFQFSCYNGNSCRYYQPPTGVPAPNPEPQGEGQRQGLAWDIGKQGGWPWPSHLWGSSSYSVVASSIIAGNTLTAVFKDKIDNTDIVEHATAAQLAAAAQYTGTVPGSVTPSGQAAAVNGGSLSLPTTGQFADASVQTGAGTGAASAVSGNGLSGGAGTGVASASGAGGSSTVLPSFGGVLTPEGHESGTTAAQHLSLPGFTGTTDPSTAQLIASVPAGKALYVPTSTSDAHYLIETNPAYTSLTAFHGSEYLLDRLGDQPQDYTFLGDSAFDQQYVQQQILTATGQTFLGGTYNTASSQMQALLDNAVTESSQLGLSLGQGLSSAQQAALSSDIVWYQNEEVDGKTVLVPKLYLAPGHEALTDTTISGRNVSLTAGSITNSGTITAQDSLSLKTTTGDITNTGRLSGGTVSLTAQDGSIINSDTLNTYLVQGGTQGQLASVGTITAKSAVSLSAGNNITFNGGAVTTGGELRLLAGEGITLGTTTVRQAASVSGKGLSESGSAVQNYGTTLNVGGDALLAALGGDLKSAGASIVSNGSTSLYAAKTLDLGSVTNSESHAVSGKKSGFLTHSSFSDSQSSSTEQGTTVAAGGSLTVVSGGDMSVKGAIGSAGDASFRSGGSFTESATHSTSSTEASHHVAGFHMSTQGASGTVGYGSRTDEQSVQTSTYTPSVIGSTTGSVKIEANGPVKIDGSAIAAAQDIGISGSSVAFTTEQNSTTQTVMHKDKSIGITGRVSPDSVVGQIINTALAATQTSGKGKTTLSALDAMQSAYLAGKGIDSGLSSTIAKMTSTNKADRSTGNIELAGVQAGVGLASNKRSVTQTETTVQGSTVEGNGTVSIIARGDNAADAQNGDLSAVAARIAGEDVIAAAQNSMTFSAGRNTTSSDSRMSSNNAFVGVDAGIGTSGAGVSVTASVGLQNQHVTTSSSTAVDTTIKAGNSVTLGTPGALTLNGAEVSGSRVDVSAGSLSIISPQ
ncbi:hemagglutinin repeat-containing protein, partial [Acetobacter indonesiensis]